MGGDSGYKKRQILNIPDNVFLILNANISYLIAKSELDLIIQHLDSNIDPIYLQLENPFAINSIIFHPKYKNVFLSFLPKYSSEIKI